MGADDPHVPSCAGVRAKSDLALPQSPLRHQPVHHHGRLARLLPGVLSGDPGEGGALHRQPDGPLPAGAEGLPYWLLHSAQTLHRQDVLPGGRPALRQLSDISLSHHQAAVCR